MATLLVSLAIFLLIETSTAQRKITASNHCSLFSTWYLHYAYLDSSSNFVQSGSQQMGYLQNYDVNFVGEFGGYIWINNENCNPFNSPTPCSENYGTMALLELSPSTSSTTSSYAVIVDDSLGGFTNSILIQSASNPTKCSQVYAYELINVYGANTAGYCDNSDSYQVIMCAPPPLSTLIGIFENPLELIELALGDILNSPAIAQLNAVLGLVVSDIVN